MTTITPVKKFTISRKEWLRGEVAGNSFLRRSRDSKMCCVGIYLRECGVPVETLCNLRTAIEVNNTLRVSGIPEWMLVKGMGENIGHLYFVNDSHTLNEQDREQKIAEHFKREGIEVEFVD